MARTARQRTKLRATATARPRRKSKAEGARRALSPPLLSLVGIGLLLSLVWFYWPAVTGSDRGAVNPSKVKDLVTQHPDAEVFDLSDNIKKKP